MRSSRTLTFGVLIAAAIIQTSCNKTTDKLSAKPVTDPQVTSSIAAKGSPAPKPANAMSTPAPVTDVESAVRRVVSWHPAIQEAAGKIRQQKELIADARSGYLPGVGGGVDLAAQTGDSGQWAPKLNVSASQMIYDFGKVSGRVEAESATYDTRRAEFLATVDDTIRETVLASVELLRNARLAVVAKEQIDDVKAIGQLVDARTDRGASTRSDKLQAEARIQAAQSTALEINADKQRWEGTLNALLGQASSVKLRPAFPTALNKACAGPPPDWDTVPVVVAARSRKQEADAQVKLARANMLPTISMEATSRFKTWGNDDSDYLVGLTVKGDLYNGGAFKARQNAARYAAEASEAAIASGKFDAQKNWIESAAQVNSLSILLKSLGSRQAMMRETRDLYQKQFLDLGTRTLLDVLNADQELHAARFDEINTRFDLYKLNVECAYSAGRLRDTFGLSSDPSHPAPVETSAPMRETHAASAPARPSTQASAQPSDTPAALAGTGLRLAPKI
ncbi:TolC family outer membrane protein [Neorhizobium sp. NCHU2750]|uniref:TolC family outer membrane protein n=1 Tax=Neorhizobium sp. NCHU2750 TaxID=1825976 RepID=UPI000E74FCF0|nr:outer membrane protein [Neorhizobium sp. NCHU2750]